MSPRMLSTVERTWRSASARASTSFPRFSHFAIGSSFRVSVFADVCKLCRGAARRVRSLRPGLGSALRVWWLLRRVIGGAFEGSADLADAGLAPQRLDGLDAER